MSIIIYELTTACGTILTIQKRLMVRPMEDHYQCRPHLQRDLRLFYIIRQKVRWNL